MNMGNNPDGRPASFTINEVWSMSILDQFTSLQGRLNRLRYLGISIIWFFLVPFYLEVAYSFLVNLSEIDSPLFEITFGLAIVPAFYSAYAITVKRLQDMNWGTGWTTYAQIYFAACASLWLIEYLIWTLIRSWYDIASLLGVFATFGSIPLFVTIFAPGERGPNQFGPDPLGNVFRPS